jgi:dihydrofolate synthase/folylpolyglutamate synthase
LHVATLPGRWQRLPARVPVYLDVAHNPHGMQAVARNMKSHGDNWHVLLAMQKDKDSLNSIAMLKPYVKHWHVCPLPPPRGATAAELAQYLPHQTIKQYSAVTAAYQQLVATLPADAQLLVVGSFATVTEVLQSSLGGRS